MSSSDPTGTISERSAVVATASLFDKMLVPVDFSAASRAAFSLAMSLAGRSTSEVWLFYAAGFDENDQFLDHTGVPWGRSDVEGEARSELRGFAEMVVPGSERRVQFETVRSENVVRAVVDACRRHATTMIVLGVHGHRSRRFRRSVAERIAHAVTCSALLVRGEPEELVDADM